MLEKFYIPLLPFILPVISQHRFIMYFLLLKIAEGSAFFTFILVSFCLLLSLFIISFFILSCNAIKMEGGTGATR